MFFCHQFQSVNITLNSWIVLLHLFLSSFMCEMNVNFESKIILRNLYCCTTGISVSSIFQIVLCILQFIQVYTFCFGSQYPKQNKKSSTNRELYILGFIHSTNLFILMLNKVTENMHPWGITIVRLYPIIYFQFMFYSFY